MEPMASNRGPSSTFPNQNNQIIFLSKHAEMLSYGETGSIGLNWRELNCARRKKPNNGVSGNFPFVPMKINVLKSEV